MQNLNLKGTAKQNSRLTRCLWFATLIQILLRKTSQTPKPLGETLGKLYGGNLSRCLSGLE